MQLAPGEKSILAYFSDRQQAQDAALALKEVGYVDLQIDGFSLYPSRRVFQSYPVNLSSMVLNSREYGIQDSRPGHDPLMAADPSVSGMSSPAESAPGYSYLLTLVIRQDRFDEALQILRQHGAKV
ncbi:hypothetical protein ASZ90_019182 [hydrocarbon metagenome]|uniref:SPOR domain-containing protein n=1 Tax=hydrocarbon metagenome TaxID=938273 RepID=A0A0W8E475_9ZZZZ